MGVLPIGGWGGSSGDSLPAGTSGYIMRYVGGSWVANELSASGLAAARPAAGAAYGGQFYWSTDAAAGLELAECVHKAGATYAWEVTPYGATATGIALVQAASAAAALATIGAESALPRLSVASALHHWRLDDVGPDFADLGSSPVSLAYVSGTREYGRAGVYTRYGATMQRSPGPTDRVEAVVSDIPADTDFTFEVTFANETGSISAPNITALAVLNNGLGAGSSYGIYLLTANSGYGLYLGVHLGAATADSAAVAVDWSRVHRATVTYVTATRTATLYLDGIAVASATPPSGTMAAITRCALGGVATAFGGVSGSTVMVADFTVHLSALSASTILSRADVCRRLAG